MHQRTKPWSKMMIGCKQPVFSYQFHQKSFVFGSSRTRSQDANQRISLSWHASQFKIISKTVEHQHMRKEDSRIRSLSIPGMRPLFVLGSVNLVFSRATTTCMSMKATGYGFSSGPQEPSNALSTVCDGDSGSYEGAKLSRWSAESWKERQRMAMEQDSWIAGSGKRIEARWNMGSRSDGPTWPWSGVRRRWPAKPKIEMSFMPTHAARKTPDTTRAHKNRGTSERRISIRTHDNHPNRLPFLSNMLIGARNIASSLIPGCLCLQRKR